MLFAVDGFDEVVSVAEPPLGQLRFLWFRFAAFALIVDGDAADTFLIRKSILLRSQSGHALSFGCLATGIISGNDDECSNLIAS